MLKVFSTNVVISKGYDNNPALRFFKDENTNTTDKNSICFEQHQKAVDILNGRKADPTFYPVIYGIEYTDDWTDGRMDGTGTRQTHRLDILLI